jgi:hypothetical protein
MQLPSGDAEMTVTKGNDNLRRSHYPSRAGFVPVIVGFKNM